MYRTVAAFLAVMLVMPIHAKKLPSEFVQCKKDDPNLDTCLVGAIEKAAVAMKDGIPSHHVLPTDPLSISKLAIEDSATRPVNLNLVITDAKLYGLKDLKVSKVKSDLSKREFWVDVTVKKLSLDGDYSMNGKFLVIPLKGNGKLSASIDDVVVKVHFRAEPKTKNGEIHWDIQVFELKVVEISRLTTKFENLFNGDQTLAKPTQESLNENWKELWESLKPALEDLFATVLSRSAATIFDEVPEKDMFL